MNPNENNADMIVETDVAMPMRDGTVLRANVFRPNLAGPFPGLLERTPYGKRTAGVQRYVAAGYVVVSQDTRGRYASDGQFKVFSIENTGDAEDGYDSVEWLARQPYCNGRVGTFGRSYAGWTQWMLAKLRPPHLLAMCAQSIPTELTDLDWPGAFRPARRVHWWLTTMAPDLRRRQGLPGPHTSQEAKAIWEHVEQARWLGLLPWARIPQYLPEGLAEAAEQWLRRPDCRPWRFAEAHHEIDVPNLDLTGWYDHCNGSIDHLAGMQQNARTPLARSQTKTIIGPWNHVDVGARQGGPVDFGPEAEMNVDEAVIRWFDRWLKGIDNGVEGDPAVRYFVIGASRWRHADTWPPSGTERITYHLSSRGDAHRPSGTGALALETPNEPGSDRYVYDPNDPVPTLWPPTLFTAPSDRRRLEYRQDILYYRTPPLSRDVEIAGNPEVVLYASSSAPDTDFFACLVDEAPDGPALAVSSGMVRARHRKSLQREDFLTPDTVTEFHIQLGPTACRFAAGHRIRLEVTSSDFPNFDRNHNTGRNDLFDTELVAARQEVFHSGPCPSRLVLPVRCGT